MPLLATIEEEGKLPYLRLLWRYRLQFQSMSAAAIVFVASGMRLAWSIFDTPAGKFLNNNYTHHLMMSWFIGAALGALLAASFVQRVTKNLAYAFSGFLLLTAGILSIALPRRFSAACYSSVSVGAAFGLTEVQALVTGAEVGHKSIRGMLLSCQRVFLWLGVCLQLLYTRLWYALEPAERGHSMDIDQLHGILICGLAVGAVLVALAHRIESPLLLLRQERDNTAVNDTLKKLNGQNELVRLREDYRQVFNAQDMIEDQEHRNWHLLRQLLPLIKVLVLRCFAAVALSLPFIRAFLVISSHGFDCNMHCLYWLSFCGLLGSIAGAFLVDQQGRRKLCWVSLFIAGILIVMVGGVFEHLEATRKTHSSINLQLIGFLMLLFEIIMSLGVAVPALVYTAEAFGVAHKAICLAGALICEQVLQLVLMNATFQHSLTDSTFFFAFGALSITLGLLVFMLMPETRHLTLYECLLKFKKVP